MSFSSTPLGQGRRLDHRTFLNKNPSSSTTTTTTTQRSRTPPLRRLPTSYSYGGPTAASRSPPKPTTSNPALDDSDPPALVRFARLKQKETTGPSPHPERWTVKDTSVQIASAFHQAASTSTTVEDSSNTSMLPNDSWASGSTRTGVPRSTSVEYEKETHTTIRRLAPPSRRPLAKANSFNRVVPDSEEEEEQHSRSRVEREKSPFGPLIDTARSLARTAEYFLRPPEDTSGHSQQNTSSSYDYSQEEQEYQQTSKNAAAKQLNRKNRISMDNKAYKPSLSDLEESDEDSGDDDGKRARRKKGKKGGAGPPLTSLPVAGYDKRRRKRKGQRADGEEEGSDDDVSQMANSFEQQPLRGTTPQPQAPSVQPPPRMPVPIPRVSVTTVDQSFNTSGANDTYDVEQALNMETIVEEDESFPTPDISYDDEKPTKPTFSLGATLGRIVHGLLSLVWRIFSLLVLKPISMVMRTNFKLVARYISVAMALYAIWYALRSGYTPSLPSWPKFSQPAPYHPPAVPPQDVSEFSGRLQELEGAFARLLTDIDKFQKYIETDTRSQADLVGHVNKLENRVSKESTRVVDIENQIRASASQGLQTMRQEIDALRAQIQSIPKAADDKEAREKLRTLEERVGTVEGDVKEAIELSKTKVEPKSGTWWKGSSSPSTITIKSTDGQDVSSLIDQLVDKAVSKDGVAKPDYALYSAGGRVIPSLTTEPLEIRPEGLFSQILGLLAAEETVIGKPPVTALHHEIHDGQCWPFQGSDGQLGVVLSAPVFVSEISIDHVPKAVASDLRSAPREMEVWGLVEGEDNLVKVKAWLERKEASRKEEAELFGEPLDGPDAGRDEIPPASLPSGAPYIRLASFTYDIHAPKHVQTFPIREEVAGLGVDFGVVVLRVKSNWGRDEFTCLYRFRVHGQRLVPVPEPWSPPTGDTISSSS